jgi:hypothetical protein
MDYFGKQKSEESWSISKLNTKNTWVQFVEDAIKSEKALERKIVD